MRQLTLSKQIISRAIIEQEVTDRRTFEKDLSKPYWPKYLSGVTILWGYDIGTVSKDKLQTDLKGILPQADIDKLKPCCGVLGTAAKKLLPIDIKMTWEQAEQLFYRTSLPDHARAAAQAYPGLENLHPYEQTVIVGLVYCRGSKLTDKTGEDRRKEMRELVEAIQADNDTLMASLVKQMKRLWEGRNMGGLLKRMDLYAELIALPDTPIAEEDKLLIIV